MIADIVFLGIVAIFAFFGVRKGLVWQLIHLAVLVVGWVLTLFLHAPIKAIFARGMGDGLLASILAYTTIFSVVGFIFFFVGAVFKGTVDTVHLKTADHVLGGVLGAIKGFVICCILILVMRIHPAGGGISLENSLITKPVAAGIAKAVDFFLDEQPPG